MTHVRTSPFYPQSNGKIERWHKSLKGECIRPGTPLSLDDARRTGGGHAEHYNNVRLNSATGYITPKDMLTSRRRQRRLTWRSWLRWLRNTRSTFLGHCRMRPADGPERRKVSDRFRAAQPAWFPVCVNHRVCELAERPVGPERPDRLVGFIDAGEPMPP